MQNFWIFRSKSHDPVEDGETLRLLGLLAWLEKDPLPLEGLIECYVKSGARAVATKRAKEAAATLPNLKQLVKLWPRVGKGLTEGPVSLQSAERLLSEEARKTMLAPFPAGVLEFENRLVEELHRMFPTATQGRVQWAVSGALAVIVGFACLMDNKRIVRGMYKVLAGRLVRGVALGESKSGLKERATTMNLREAVVKVRELLRQHHSQTRLENLQRDARAWVCVWKDHKGDPLAAWEEIKEWNQYTTYLEMIKAIRPFNNVFGLALKEGRRRVPRAPKAKGPRIAPTQKGAWYVVGGVAKKGTS